MGEARAGETAARNYGLDLLRIVSIALVVTLHVLGHGGVLESAQSGWSMATAWLLEAAALCAVDCFVLITGYCMCAKGFQSRRVLSLWVQVFFYSVVVAAVMLAVDPALDVAKLFPAAFFPVMTNQWWFFTQYFGLLFLMPLLNGAIRVVRDSGHVKLLFAAVVVVFCVVPFVAHADLFRLSNGYSLIWFALLYLMGACMRYVRVSFSHPKLVYGFLYLAAAAVLCALYLLIRKGALPFLSPWESSLYSYTSPFVLVEALALFRLFEGMSINGAPAKRIVGWMAPAVFAVYLISDHKLVRAHFVSDTFSFLGEAAPWEIVGCVVGSVLAIMLACIVVERLRLLLFKVLRIDGALKALGAKIDVKLGLRSA